MKENAMTPTRTQGDVPVADDSAATPSAASTAAATKPVTIVAAPASGASSEQFVRYVGPATRRILTPEDWKRVGAEGQGYAEWNIVNSLKLPVSQFSPEALKYLMEQDDRFVVE